MASADHVDPIVISDIYDRHVSDVVLVCPYTGANAITDELGFDWSGANRLADQLDSHDSDQAVIAVHQGEVVESEVVPIDVLDLCDMGLAIPPRSEQAPPCRSRPRRRLGGTARRRRSRWGASGETA